MIRATPRSTADPMTWPTAGSMIGATANRSTMGRPAAGWIRPPMAMRSVAMGRLATDSTICSRMLNRLGADCRWMTLTTVRSSTDARRQASRHVGRTASRSAWEAERPTERRECPRFVPSPAPLTVSCSAADRPDRCSARGSRFRRPSLVRRRCRTKRRGRSGAATAARRMRGVVDGRPTPPRAVRCPGRGPARS